ncbi:hypothetical protein CRG98_020783 [Punica granatum]|uniref:Uncharacterized protein n=1 Tax=Punica granatum TaxID=22663 RepID=A0A2I0JSE3_PUNGR|nr:hypothetical protein CRG98_020783 [Punica granatum]
MKEEEWRKGSGRLTRVIDHCPTEMGSSPYRLKCDFYMISERITFLRACVGSHHARFDFEAVKSAPHINQARQWSGLVQLLRTGV